ncbi:Porin [Tumidithrix helvetica PCC 7403]|uniref:hypothetical protein n=1 Tax=Tumidithrix helvetica TaxID=3457545 RepID=UPI003CAF9F43
MDKLLILPAIAIGVWLTVSQSASVWAQDRGNKDSQDNDNQVRSTTFQTIENQKRSLFVGSRSRFTTVQEIERSMEGDRQLLLATPDGFNPGLRDRIPEPLSVQDFTAPSKLEPTVIDYAVLDNLKLNFQNSTDSSGQHNQIIEPTWQWRFQDGTVVSFQTGFNSFDLVGKQSVRNVPLQFGIVTKLGSIALDARAGIDVYDRLPTTANFEVNTSMSVLPGMTLFGFLEQKPYKSSATSLNNQIKTRRFGPTIYWQLDPYTTLFSLYRWGNYNDGNNEQQSFSRIERKFGQFSVAGNLFIWFYDREATGNTYFAPPDFLVYSGEVAWEGQVLDILKCRLAANLGEQRGNDAFSPARSFQSLCTLKVSPSIEADLGYTYSNIRKTETDATSVSEAISGQLRVKF